MKGCSGLSSGDVNTVRLALDWGSCTLALSTDTLSSAVTGEAVVVEAVEEEAVLEVEVEVEVQEPELSLVNPFLH